MLSLSAQPKSTLPSRWTTLRHHEQQSRLMRDAHRFIVIAAGRRSGKTEVGGLRKPVKRLMAFRSQPDGNFLFAAPTRDHAKRLFWENLKALIPRSALACKPHESDLRIDLVTGAKCRVAGLDSFERQEGEAFDGVVLDEFAKTKPLAWYQTLRPALDTLGREGWAILLGRPRGRNHFWQLAKYAQDPANAAEWSYYHWTSSTVLRPEIVEQAKRDLDPLLFRQEYEADFLNFEGRAYWAYESTVHSDRCYMDRYDPDGPIYVCFDFNVKPGVAEIVIEDKQLGTICEGEVYIPDDSNTRRVCRKLLEGLSDHRGEVIVDGDATGGNRGSAKLEGSDWDIIAQEFRPVFGDRFRMSVRDGNPAERSRVNAMNLRMRSAAGDVRFHSCPTHNKRLNEDLEGVTVLEGSDGEIDKGRDKSLTHTSDAVGYHVEHRFPADDGETKFDSEAMF